MCIPYTGVILVWFVIDSERQTSKYIKKNNEAIVFGLEIVDDLY